MAMKASKGIVSSGKGVPGGIVSVMPCAEENDSQSPSTSRTSCQVVIDQYRPEEPISLKCTGSSARSRANVLASGPHGTGAS